MSRQTDARRAAGLRRPPGPRINFLLAAISQMMPKRFPFDPLAFGLNIAREHGDIAYYRVGPLHVYQLAHPDLARQILIDQPDKFHKSRFIRQAFGPFAGDGLLTSDGALWKQQRKLMQPAFHHAQLVSYGAEMVRHALRMSDAFADGSVLEVDAEMAKLTMGIVVQSLFGADVTGQAEELGRLMLAVLDAANQRLNSVLRTPAWVPTARNLRERRALAAFDEILYALIIARRASRDDTRHDLLSMLLAAFDEDSGVRMSDRQLRDEMMTLFLAGHETTAMALTWTWYLLSRHPEVEAKLLDEIRRALQGRTPTPADLANLPYTEMVVREAMRLYPPAAGVAREPIEDVEIGGYVVPKGSLVTANMFALHRDPRFFDAPERFDPERFARGWEDRIPRGAYLPFGGGPRVCIGNGFAMMEARLILATLAQRWRLTLEPDQQVTPTQLVTVRPKNGLRMRVELRTENSEVSTPTLSVQTS
jgi:cytochrome P450